MPYRTVTTGEKLPGKIGLFDHQNTSILPVFMLHIVKLSALTSFKPDTDTQSDCLYLDTVFYHFQLDFSPILRRPQELFRNFNLPENCFFVGMEKRT